MTNPADKQIVDLIEYLIKESKRTFVSEETRAKYISEVATLRASMNPTIIMKKD